MDGTRKSRTVGELSFKAQLACVVAQMAFYGTLIALVMLLLPR
ncbi:hypothetical protein [Mycobacterium haemophilum]|nr:hypothetical protein [Mycobacterium haemophilum]